MTTRERSTSATLQPIAPGRWWAGVILLICSAGVLLLRLFELQIVEGSAWADRAEQNRLFGSLTAPGRSVIFDRYGEPLVLNETEYYKLEQKTALFGPSQLVSADEGLRMLATESGSVRQQFHRLYPLGPVLAPTLGYVTAVTADELLSSEGALSSYDQTGKQGMEQRFDRQLRGAPGEEQYEISALGIKRRLIKKTDADEGEPLTTTIDPFLSAVSYRALGDNRGAVVIADAATGDILTLVSAPSYDPNLLTVRTSDSASESARRQAVQAMFTDERQLFFNRAVSGTYPPGSIFKLVTALAALQSGNVSESTEIMDEGILRVGDFSYANWYYTQYGRTEGAVNLRRAIARSNDIYFYKAAEAAGPDLIASIAHSVGFGQPVGIELGGEQGGLVPDPRWKEAVRGERWFLGNTYHYGIGQGDLLVTPVQVAQLVQAIANNGTTCPLHLAKSEIRNCEVIGLNEDDLELVVQGMLDACSQGGTAFPFFSWNSAHAASEPTADARLAAGQAACKTGTAEFGGTDEKGFKKTHGWFAMTVGVKDIVAGQLAGSTQAAEHTTASGQLSPDSATPAAQVRSRSLPMYLEKSRWLEEVRVHGFPEKLAIAVLVESDEARPYREGSADASPVAKEILDWIAGQQQ